MGGFGSTRWNAANVRACTDDYYRLNVREIQECGGFDCRPYKWSWNNGKAVIDITPDGGGLVLEYRVRTRGEQEWRRRTQRVEIDWTSCHYGKGRPWFLCPSCHRRCMHLYAAEEFACRTCLNLTYPSQRENGLDRLCRRADKIRRKLGWEPGILNGLDHKPKGMHQSTFDKLLTEYAALLGLIRDGFTQIGLLEKHYGEES